MPLAVNLQSAFTRVATEFKAIRTLISGSGTGTIGGLNTTDKTSLVSAINEVNSKPAATTTLAALTDTAISSPLTGHLIQYNATTAKWENVLGTNVYQPLDGDLTAIAALTTSAYGRNLLALANQAAFLGLIPSATTSVEGKAQVATTAEITTGTENTNHFVNSKGLQDKLTAWAQPLDGDLTAIAALSTTTFGRNLLQLADAAALTGLIGVASETAQGIVELATTAEVTTGTDTARAATSAGVKAHIDSRISTAAALGTSNTLVPSQGAVKAYADALLDANNAFVYKGGIDCSTNPNYPAASAGWTYKVTVAGRIGGASGPAVEVGDTATCLVDGSAAGTHATVGNNWIVSQTNIDGAVIGPASSAAGNFASFSGTTGKLIADSGFSPSSYYTRTEIGNPETDYVAAFEAALA